MKKYFLLISIYFLLIFSSSINAQQYYTVPEVLKYLFPHAEKVDFEKKSLSKEQLKKIRQHIKSRDLREKWTIYIARSKDKIDGYAIIDNVMGKEMPITYVVSITPDGQVREVEVMIYRESHGGQIKNKTFRKQFIGKNSQNPLKVGHGITNISGATISVKHISFGVKRVLAVWNEFYKNY